MTEKCAGKKHIAMYIGSLNKGGAERVMSNLAEFFFREGYRVTLVTTYLADDEYELSDAKWSMERESSQLTALNVLTPEDVSKEIWMKDSNEAGIERVFTALLKSERGNRVVNFHRRVKKLRDTWKTLKPDVILSFLGKNNVMALYSANGLGIPVVVSVRSDPAREYASKGLNLSMRWLFPKAAGVVVQTTEAREYFNARIRCRCKILPNSINREFIESDITEFTSRTKTVVTVGRLDDNKNQGLLIRCFAKALRDNPEYKLEIYGDGPSRNKFEDEAHRLGLTDNRKVVFMGNVDNVPAKIKRSMIFALTSKQEGMPNALIEAMSLGLVCISTDCPCGGPRDIIDNGKNGMLISASDDTVMEEELTAALNRVMSDMSFSEELSKNAVYVRERYNPEKINNMWKSYLENLIEC